MTSRQKVLLLSIINEYVSSALPVSSKLLEKMGFFGLKSATIRMEMNDLEDSGFLAQLHTSGGRVPTDKAYRYFVDNIVISRGPKVEKRDKERIKNAICNCRGDTQAINKTIAKVLSEMSDNLVITNIVDGGDFFKVGLSGLFEMPEFKEFEKVFKLTSFFDEFDEMFSQLTRQIFSDMDDGLKIFIGRENPIKNVHDETVMFARYNLPKNNIGALTLVGPTRMNYDRNIGLIKYTVDEINRLTRGA